MSDALDDAAARALLPLRHAPMEQIGALYSSGGDIASTPTVTTNHTTHVGGTLRVPKGAALALFHQHPPGERMKGDVRHDIEGERSKFSRDDILQARAIGLPSYIGIDDRIMRYDPKTGRVEEVLAQIPAESIPPRISVDDFRLRIAAELAK